MELPGLLSQVNANPSSIGIDRADYLYLIANDYCMTMRLMLRRLQDRMDGPPVDGDVVEAEQHRFPIAEIMQLRQSLQYLCCLLSNRDLALSNYLQECLYRVSD